MSSSNFQLILDALDDYAKQTGIDLSKNPFAKTLRDFDSPNAIIQLLQEKAKAFQDFRDRNRKLITWLSPVVQVVHAFSGILGQAATIMPFQPASVIFAGIDVLITTASGVSASYDALIDLFECIGNFLNRLRIYTEIPSNPAMTDIIVKILVELLSVFALATKQIKQGRFKKFAKKLLGESEVEAVLQRLDRLTQEESRMTVTQTLEVVHGLVNNMKVVMDDGKTSMGSMRQALVFMQETADEMNKMKREKLQDKIRSWLSPPDPSKNHNIACDAYQAGTAAWFIQGSMFAKWKETGSLLWIHGKPGSGKSVLLSAVIRDIEGVRSTGLASLAYYYFDFRDAGKQHRRGLLSSLLAQLCARSDPCYDIVSRLYSTYDAGTKEPTDGALTECLKVMLRLPGAPTYIIIDGLDECPNNVGLPTAREKVLELVEELINLKLPNVHICVSSRPEIDIQIVLEDLTSLRLSLHEESGQKKDIMNYIGTVVNSDRKMRRWRAEDKQLVVDALSEKADGMFRWVFCQLEMLRRCFSASIRRALRELPETLDETYERTLLGIDKEKRDYACHLFQCLAVSIRPLFLNELAEVLAVQFDTGSLPHYNADWRPEDAQEAVLSACSSLVVIVNVDGSQVVQFSHFSVKEFLTSDRLSAAREQLSFYHILPSPAHTILAKACLSVLLELDDRTDKNTIENHPIAPYAAEYWVNHAQFENVASHIQGLMELLFDAEKPHFASWIWMYDMDHLWEEHMSTVHPTQPGALPIYYASLCGFESLVESLSIKRPSDVNAGGGFYKTPLHAAFGRENLKIILLLLERGAEMDAKDREGLTTLQRASRGGHLEIVRSLLAHNANVNARDDESATALSLAAGEGELEISRLLLQHGADVNSRSTDSQDTKLWTALHSASRFGHFNVAQLLVDHGAEVNAQKEDLWTPLHLASTNGHLEVVKFLIERGADIDMKDSDQNTPLDRALLNGNVQVARLLIERGATADARDSEGWTPVHFASRYGYPEIVQLLLDRDANVNAQKDDLWTPIHLASNNGHLEVARLLVERGADIDGRDVEQKTPLNCASCNGYLEIARLLIERGADVNSRTNKGWTPLHSASRFGYLGVVQLLLDHDANVNAQKDDLWTPIHLASNNGHLEVAKLLVERGADIDGRDMEQKTPLDCASCNGYLEIARLLIERGANVNSRTNKGWTPLHSASRYGYPEIVQLLLDYDANVNAQKEDLWTPIHLASNSGYLKVAQLLVQRGADVDKRCENQETPLHKVSSSGYLDIARLLVESGSSVGSQDKNGWSPLHAASHNGHLHVVRQLLEWGADPNLRNESSQTPFDLASENGKLEVANFLGKAPQNEHPDPVESLLDRKEDSDTSGSEGETSLHSAVEEGDLDAVRSILERGGDVDVRDSDNVTPLLSACRDGKFEVADLLIKHSADVNLRDDYSWAPLHRASRCGHLDIVRLLLDHGADIDARKQDYWTPLHLAVRSDYFEIVELLLERGANVQVRNDEGRTPYHVALRRKHSKIVELLSRYCER